MNLPSVIFERRWVIHAYPRRISNEAWDLS